MNNINLSETEFNNEPYITETSIKDLLIIRRPRYIDNRGAFQEQYRRSALESKIGRKVNINQAQISWSKIGVLRGIHFEPQDKIVTPITGRSFCVYLDLRTDSPTFKESLSLEFDNTQNEPQLITVFIPEGVGNSLCVFSKKGDPKPGTVIYQYSVTKEYDPKTAGIGIIATDPELNISWPIKNAVLSERDLKLPSLKEFLKIYRNING